MLTTKDWLDRNIKVLETMGIPTARLDAVVLLADQLSKDRSWLHAHMDYVIDDRVALRLKDKVERRANHEPLAYIRGKQEFYGRNFFVTPDTLTPRPETETLVELALKFIKKENIQSVADVGTGSGCIAITLSLEAKPNLIINGYDISKPALKIARKNNLNLNSKVKFWTDDLALNKDHRWQNSQMIVANLPYVPDNFHINLAASHEPEFAIFGGDDGLDLYRSLFNQSTKRNQYILTESLPAQHNDLKSIAKNHGFVEVEKSDFIQVFSSK